MTRYRGEVELSFVSDAACLSIQVIIGYCVLWIQQYSDILSYPDVLQVFAINWIQYTICSH